MMNREYQYPMRYLLSYGLEKYVEQVMRHEKIKK